MDVAALHETAHPLVRRMARCACGQAIYFGNHQCLHCGLGLGYDPQQSTVLALPAEGGTGWRRCANFTRAPQCNWLLGADDDAGQDLCRCCRLNRVVPNAEHPDHAAQWASAELAKRRLVSSLIALGLPVASRVSEDTERGLAFDLLADVQAAPVLTGHSDGIITINLREADDAAREAIRHALHEPYRSMLGHVRHESGHYYWSRLLEDGPWHAPFRALFGDERTDYAQALQKHYDRGPDAQWAQHGVSAYASAHPWEDWAETWAHYLHMRDTLDAAWLTGLDAGTLATPATTFDAQALYCPPQQDALDAEFLGFVNTWMPLTAALNELSLGMGLPDFYPFVLSPAAVTKLHFVHCFIRSPAMHC